MVKHSNDWAARIVSAADDAAKGLDKAEALIPSLALHHVAPYIGMRVQEGAMHWRPYSDEAIKGVKVDIFDAAGVNSLPKDKDSLEFRIANKRRTALNRAVDFYRAVSILTERHQCACDMENLLFPAAWFYAPPKDAGETDATPQSVMLPAKRGTKVVLVPYVLDTPRLNMERMPYPVKWGMSDGSMESSRVSVSVAGICELAKPKVKRAAQTPDSKAQDADATPVAGTAADAAKSAEVVSSFLAKVDGAPISGDAAESIAVIIAHIAHNDSLWSLAMAEREAWQTARAVEEGKAA